MPETNPFTKALIHMDEHGWTKNTFATATGKVCLDGALRGSEVTILSGCKVRNDHRCPSWKEYCLLVDIIDEQFPELLAQYRKDRNLSGLQPTLYNFVWQFNDDFHVTESDVRLVLEKAAIKWEEKVNGV